MMSLYIDLSLSNLPNLESLSIGSGSFRNIKSFTLSHNPKLKTIEIEPGYKEDWEYMDCVFYYTNELMLIGMY